MLNTSYLGGPATGVLTRSEICGCHTLEREESPNVREQDQQAAYDVESRKRLMQHQG